VTSFAPPIEPDVFVRVADGRFVIGDAPFAFVGANVAVTHSAPHRASLEAALDAVVADGGTVIRVWALGEAPPDAPAWRREYAMRVGPEGWVEESFVHLDRVLFEARRRGLRVVVVLANRWGDYGGFSELARWAGIPPRDRDLSPAELETFLACERCDALFDAHVRRLIERVNTRSGVAYRDDPTVLAWELVNEVTATTAAGERALVAWVERHARTVRELAPRQLVSAGHLGWRTFRDRAVWRAVHASPSIDYADLHAYPRRDPRVRSLRDLHAWIDVRAADARALGKPLVIGELGFSISEPDAARWLDAFLQRARRVGVAGVLLWIYRVSGYRDPYAVHFDRPHARAIRRAMARNARAFVERSTPLALDVREEPPPLARCPGRPLLHDAWIDERLVLDPARFALARFEACGLHAREDAPAEAHLWGAGEGFVEWRIRVRRRARYVLEATLSTELPGLGGGGPDDVGSLRTRVDGVVVDERALLPDDGRGRAETISLGELAPGLHRVRLETVERPGRGLAVYARAPMVVRVE
jgi:mannan endo-1,4-beta-mannosidase